MLKFMYYTYIRSKNLNHTIIFTEVIWYDNLLLKKWCVSYWIKQMQNPEYKYRIWNYSF